MSGTVTGEKISALPPAQALSNTDIVPISQIVGTAYATGAVQMQNIRAYVGMTTASGTSASVAAAGASLSTATALTAQFNAVTSGTGGVALPSVLNTRISIYNRTGAAINVYPNTSSQAIDGNTAGSPISLAPGASYSVVCFSASQCYTDS